MLKLPKIEQCRQKSDTRLFATALLGLDGFASKETREQKCALDASQLSDAGHIPSWLNGAHLEEHEGKVTRQVRFHSNSNCHYCSANIQVKN